jgi:transcription elongation factor Elf1
MNTAKRDVFGKSRRCSRCHRAESSGCAELHADAAGVLVCARCAIAVAMAEVDRAEQRLQWAIGNPDALRVKP